MTLFVFFRTAYNSVTVNMGKKVEFTQLYNLFGSAAITCWLSLQGYSQWISYFHTVTYKWMTHSDQEVQRQNLLLLTSC